MEWPEHLGEGVVRHGRDPPDLVGAEENSVPAYRVIGVGLKGAWGQQPGLELHQKAAQKAVMLLGLNDPTLPKGDGFQGRFHHRLGLELV